MKLSLIHIFTWDSLKNNNDLTIDEIKNRINVILWSNNENLILTTWSLWRWEDYGKINDIELLIYWENNNEIGNELKTILATIKWKFKILIEAKKAENVVFYEKPINWNCYFFPSRFIDNYIIFGLQEYLEKLKLIFIESIKKSTKEQKKFWNWKIRYHKKISINWVGNWKKNSFSLYDVDKKIVKFNKSKDFEVSIKIWPLRYIQYIITNIILKLIRNNQLISDNLSNVWKNISTRLDYFFDNNITDITKENNQELIWLYNFFIWIHNFMNYNFNNSNDWNLYLSDEDFKIFIENLSNFNKLIEIFNKSIKIK